MEKSSVCLAAMINISFLRQSKALGPPQWYIFQNNIWKIAHFYHFNNKSQESCIYMFISQILEENIVIEALMISSHIWWFFCDLDTKKVIYSLALKTEVSVFSISILYGKKHEKTSKPSRFEKLRWTIFMKQERPPFVCHYMQPK